MTWFAHSKISMMLFVFVAAVVLGGAHTAIADFVISDPVFIDEAINAPGTHNLQGHSLLHDGLKLYYVANHAGTAGMWVSKRESTDSPWGEPVYLSPYLNPDESWAYDPTVSPDDLELYFWQKIDDVWYKMRSTRSSTDEDWGRATEYTGVFPDDFSSDGLTKYSYWSGGYGRNDIWVTTWVTVADDWGDPVNLGLNVNDSGDQWMPSISNDSLALFFVSNQRINMCARSSTNDDWGPAIDLDFDYTHPVLYGQSCRYGWPEISPDGSTLYLDSHRSNSLGNRESFWQASITPIVDFNGDGIVGFEDLLRLADSWCQYDSWVDVGPMAWGDGLVNAADLAVLMSYWGQQVSYTTDMRVDFTLAWNPKPADGYTTDVEKALPLTWTPGDRSALQDVYLGTDRIAVDAADTSDTTGIYRGRQDSSHYAALEGVEAGQTYYWRIDAFRPGAPTSKGKIWTFIAADYLIVDDFESYTDNMAAGETIFHTWLDGAGYLEPAPGYPGNGTGALVGYWQPPHVEVDIVHGGHQALPLFYDNDGTLFEGDEEWEITGLPYHSEAQREWELPQDWTRKGVETLVLWFHGDPGNALEPFYVALQDSEGNSHAVEFPIPGAVLLGDWYQWPIALTDFTGVNLKAIKKMSIGVGDKTSTQPAGSGVMYIDDIQLHRP